MKVLFTSIFALFLATSAWATGELTAPAVCNVTDLGASEGPLNIDLVWEANTINTTWYSEGVQIQDAPQSCSYSSTMTLPTAPSRAGYVFAGWKLRCNIPSGLGQTPSSYGYMGANNQAYNNVYGLTEPGTWATTWPNGDVLYGVSVWADNYTGTAPSGSTEPIYCWCGITGYRPSGGTRCDLASTSWMANQNLIATVSVDIDTEGELYDVGACARACVTKYYAYYNGWQETLVPRVQQCPIPSSLAMTSASSYGYINPNGQAYNNTYGLTENGTWAATWPNGDVVYGVAECADNYSGTAPSGHTSNEVCWCGVTGYQPSGGSRCNLSNTSWIGDDRITATISIEMDSEDIACSNGCAQACVTRAPQYGAWRDLFGMPTCNVPSSLFATNPSVNAYTDGEGQEHNPNGLSFLGVPNRYGTWAARWNNGDAVAGVAWCVEQSEAESMINVSSGSLSGAALGCESGNGLCVCMCGLMAYKLYSGDACIINSLSDAIWMNDVNALSSMALDMDVAWGECEDGICSQYCSTLAFGYNGWRHTYGLQ